MGICSCQSKTKSNMIREILQFESQAIPESNVLNFHISKDFIVNFPYYKKIFDPLDGLKVESNIKILILTEINHSKSHDWFNFFNKIEKRINRHRNKESEARRNPTMNLISVINCINFKQKVEELISFALTVDDLNKELVELLSKGPPNNIRWIIWVSIVKKTREKRYRENYDIYHQLLKLELPGKIDEQIKKDLYRTAPDLLLFHSEKGLKALYNVLKACALYEKKISYVQGINILVANLLVISDCNQEETFFVLSNFLLEAISGGGGFFISGFPKLYLYIYIIKNLISRKFKEIQAMIDELSPPDEIWIFKWIQTFFGNAIDISIGVRLMDCLFAYGIEYIFNFSLGFVKFNSNKIISSNDIVEFADCFKDLADLRSVSREQILEYREKIIKFSKEITIGDMEIKDICKEYFDEKTKINNYGIDDESEIYSESDLIEYSSEQYVKILYKKIKRIKGLNFPNTYNTSENKKDNSFLREADKEQNHVNNTVECKL